MLTKVKKWKPTILRRRNLDLDMVFIDPTQCWHFKPKVLKMFQKVTQKHFKIKVRAYEKQLQKPYQKTAWNTTAFSWFLVPNGNPKRPQNLSFFLLWGNHWDTLWLWNGPGGTHEPILLQNISFERFSTFFRRNLYDCWMTSWCYGEGQ